MRASLILCTKNGGERLRSCLGHIDALESEAPFEVLLVDNGSTDGISWDLIQSFAASCRHECRVFQTFKTGNSAGRNVAVKEARGKLLLFIDDDCYVDSQFVDEWILADQRHVFGVASGMIIRYSEQQSGLGCKVHPEDQLIEPDTFVPRGFVQGSNMAFQNDCLREMGLFDERFGAGTRFAGEEWDVALRAGLKGWRCAYVPGPKVWHDHGRRDQDARERQIYYDYGAGAVYAKNSFGRRGAGVVGQFIRDLKNNNSDPRRILSLLGGYLDFLFLSAFRRQSCGGSSYQASQS
jgi:GT2 family glycosyltransferase